MNRWFAGDAVEATVAASRRNNFSRAPTVVWRRCGRRQGACGSVGPRISARSRARLCSSGLMFSGERRCRVGYFVPQGRGPAGGLVEVRRVDLLLCCGGGRRQRQIQDHGSMGRRPGRMLQLPIGFRYADGSCGSTKIVMVLLLVPGKLYWFQSASHKKQMRLIIY